MLDLDYTEDSNAEVDANFVMTASGGIVEAQSTAEQTPISKEQFDELFTLAKEGVSLLISAQRKAIFSSMK
jgi:ribonuclease PH